MPVTVLGEILLIFGTICIVNTRVLKCRKMKSIYANLQEEPL